MSCFFAWDCDSQQWNRLFTSPRSNALAQVNSVFLRDDFCHPSREFVAPVKLELHPLVSVQTVERQRRDIFLQPLQYGTNCLPHPYDRRTIL